MCVYFFACLPPPALDIPGHPSTHPPTHLPLLATHNMSKVKKFQPLLSQRIWIALALFLPGACVVSGITLTLDDMPDDDGNFLISGSSNTVLESVSFRVLNGDDCTKLEKFMATEPSGNSQVGTVTQLAEEV